MGTWHHVLLTWVLVVAVHQAGLAQQTWVATWAASQQIPEPRNAMASADLKDTTLRETVHVSRGGSVVRVHVSNAFGTEALHLTSVHIARPTASGASSIDPGSARALLFN